MIFALFYVICSILYIVTIWITERPRSNKLPKELWEAFKELK